MKRSTSPPELLLPIEPSHPLPLRTQLERGLRDAIRTGRLAGGALLPSTRALARDLNVSRGVVVEAFEQLQAEGYLTARIGSATRVAGRHPQAAPAAPSAPPATPLRIDFRPGLPDVSAFPRRAWLASLRRVLASAPDAIFGYPEPAGAAPARAAIAAYLNRARGTMAHTDRVVLCAGFAQGLRLVGQVLRQRGVRRIAVENPGHAEQRADLEALGLETRPVPVDDGGLRVERLHRMDVGAVLVTPAHQFPTGAVLAPARRNALLDWASRGGGAILEDDYDAEYRYDRQPIGALQGLAPDRVIYMGSASKTLAPALRLGWLVLPAHIADEVAVAKLHADRGSPALDQLAFADFIERGELDRHLRKTRRRYRRRRDALIGALQSQLPHLRIRGVAAGLHLLVELGPFTDEKAVVASAARQSVRVYAAGPHRVGARTLPPSLLLGYGALAETEIVRGVTRLASVLAGESRRRIDR